MEFKDISLGDKVRFKYSDYPEEDGIVIFLGKHRQAIGVSFSASWGSYLSGHVTHAWGSPIYFLISNIEDYHDKPHEVMEIHNIIAILTDKDTSKPIDSIGCFCSVCEQFSALSEPNQPDNSFKCYSCRVQPLRAYY